MKSPLLAALLLCALSATAQTNHLPVSNRLWGQSSEEVDAWLLQAPGFKRVSTKRTGNTAMLSYDRTDTRDEALVYHFRNDSLLMVTRIALAKREPECGPWEDWEKVGTNEWTVAASNVWIRRVYDGQFIRDTMRRIHL